MKAKKYYAYFSLLVILAFMTYIVYDSVKPVKEPAEPDYKELRNAGYKDRWFIRNEVFIRKGLKAVAVSDSGEIFLGGTSFLSCYDRNLNKNWEIGFPADISALAVFGDTIYATSDELVYVLGKDGKIKAEWGPYDEGSLFTSVSANRRFVAVADAGNKIVFIIRKDGEVYSMTGHFGEKLHIPSPYFDVALTADNLLIMANTGNYRIETRTLEGNLLSSFGNSGMKPEGFCGCCNPAHFAMIPHGFVTAEKGINRIKILDFAGEFLELVSSVNNFTASVPLDVASYDGKTIYCANPADSKLYVFNRSENLGK
jgi:hypothetical protein